VASLVEKVLRGHLEEMIFAKMRTAKASGTHLVASMFGWELAMMVDSPL